METLSYIVGGLFLFFAIMFLVKKRRLKGYSRQRIEKLWESAETEKNLSQRVLRADSVLRSVYKELGYKGSLGFCLKWFGKKLPNLEEVWWAHKLRNEIAHSASKKITEKDAARAMQAFRRAITSFF